MNKEGFVDDSYIFENKYGFVSMNWDNTVEFDFTTNGMSLGSVYRGNNVLAAERAFDYYRSVLRWCQRHNYKYKQISDEIFDKSESKEYKNNSGKTFLASHNFLYEVGVVANGKSGVCTYWGHDYAAAEKTFDRCRAILQRCAEKNNARMH